MYTNGDSITYRSDRQTRKAAAGRTTVAGQVPSGRAVSAGLAEAADRRPQRRQGYGGPPAEPEERGTRLEATVERLEATVARLEWAIAGLVGAVSGLEGRMNVQAAKVAGGNSAEPAGTAAVDAAPQAKEGPQEAEARPDSAAEQPRPRVSLYAGSGATATSGQVRIHTEES